MEVFKIGHSPTVDALEHACMQRYISIAPKKTNIKKTHIYLAIILYEKLHKIIF